MTLYGGMASPGVGTGIARPGAACRATAAAEEEYDTFSFDYVCLDVLVPTSGVGYFVIGGEEYFELGYQVFFFYLVL